MFNPNYALFQCLVPVSVFSPTWAALPIYPDLPNYALFQCWPGKTTEKPEEQYCYIYISIPSPTQEYPFPVFIWKTTAATMAALIHIYPVLPNYAPFLCLPKKTTAATSKLCPVPLFLCLPKKTTAATRAGLIYIIIYPALTKYALYPCICVYLKRQQQPQGQGWYT